MLMWETASMCVCNWETKARKQLQQSTFFLIVFPVLPKFYENMNKNPCKKSKHLISAQGAYSNHYGTLLCTITTLNLHFGHG